MKGGRVEEWRQGRREGVGEDGREGEEGGREGTRRRG